MIYALSQDYTQYDDKINGFIGLSPLTLLNMETKINPLLSNLSDSNVLTAMYQIIDRYKVNSILGEFPLAK
jgi:hypothetical protein